MDNFEESQDHEDDPVPLETLAEWAIGASIDIINILEDNGATLKDENIAITATFNAAMLLETLWAFLDILDAEEIIDIETLEKIVEARKKYVNIPESIH